MLISEIYPAQLRADMKEELALEYSGNRTKRTSELTALECDMAINALNLAKKRTTATHASDNEGVKQINKMFAVMRSLNWDYNRLSEFIIGQTKGVKNHSRQLTSKELNTIVSVMEKIETHNAKKK